jgi:hypothetical protein
MSVRAGGELVEQLWYLDENDLSASCEARWLAVQLGRGRKGEGIERWRDREMWMIEIDEKGGRRK